MEISKADYDKIEQNLTGKMVSVVMDGYDFEEAVRQITSCKFKDLITSTGGTFVVRPDSGNPVDMVIMALEIIGKNVGYTTNSKGYKVLHDSYRVIQGDGVNIDEIKRILTYMESKGWSSENVAFGMGGGLLQQHDRDTQKFAMKCSAAIINSEYRDVFKMPKTDPTKASKKGFLDLIATYPNESDPTKRGYVVVSTSDYENRVHKDSAMVLLFENGKIMTDFELGDIRNRSDIQSGYIAQ
jgi:nicotinamide phosphoribosyltransferase